MRSLHAHHCDDSNKSASSYALSHPVQPRALHPCQITCTTTHTNERVHNVHACITIHKNCPSAHTCAHICIPYTSKNLQRTPQKEAISHELIPHIQRTAEGKPPRKNESMYDMIACSPAGILPKKQCCRCRAPKLMGNRTSAWKPPSCNECANKTIARSLCLYSATEVVHLRSCPSMDARMCQRVRHQDTNDTKATIL